MKKVLLASTALVATAGFAAAEVSLSARAEMGIFGGSTNNVAATAPTRGGVDIDESQTRFFTDIDVTFSLSGETDGGLSFGAAVDLDEGGAGAAAVANNDDDGGIAIFISGDFGTLTMGDTDGALDWALTEAGNVGNPGSLADDETTHAGYLGAYLDGGVAGSGDGQILRWDYTSGAFGVAVSLEDDNGSTAASTNIGYAIGFKYSLDLSGTTVNFGLGYQKAADDATGALAPLGNPVDAKATGVSVSANFANGLSAGVTYTDMKNMANDKHYSLGLGYTTGAISVHANYGKFTDNAAIAGGADVKGYGLAAAYDLGGGAVVHFGYGSSKPTGGVTAKSMSLGLGLSF
jgi:outer membrane protein OmpU